ncbi:hypothetical protein [Bacillus thuringiensis]|uniref:hypothetical protein n=1 Tax=Bacillus thuringiensis TaxID=1428 RepID=UPI0026E31FB4|nr:hypothetical protein [Bacillus thuringiensis]MDO6634111.1 hypothetical protein [Bacillus thuringiensis]MDO6663601.1 hypothetical protein [Bacillus thuringiensis]MDO6704281.1 hypothetical protein [Bacillus thuringiensis]
MAKYRHIQTSFWSDPRVSEEMTPEDKFFYLYLLTNEHTHQIGVYRITKKQIAFELGYSIESVKSLLERFIKHHKIVVYNEKTREICILNWGKYNLKKGGKPIEDCIKKELEVIEDLSLVQKVLERTENEELARKISVYAGFDDTSTIRGQKEKENKKENKNKKNIKPSRHKYETCDMKAAKYLFEKIKENNLKQKEPSSFDSWANNIRLMRERDNRTLQEIKEVIDWCQNDSFWKSNILSTAKLRQQFDQLYMKMNETSGGYAKNRGRDERFNGKGKSDGRKDSGTGEDFWSRPAADRGYGHRLP